MVSMSVKNFLKISKKVAKRIEQARTGPTKFNVLLGGKL